MPVHMCEKLSEIEEKAKEQMEELLKEAKEKSDHCSSTSNMLSDSLNELSLQRDNAKSLIEETYISYKAILEKYKVGCFLFAVDIL